MTDEYDVFPIVTMHKEFYGWGHGTKEEMEAEAAEWRKKWEEERKFWPTVKRRLKNAWLALKGWPIDDEEW